MRGCHYNTHSLSNTPRMSLDNIDVDGARQARLVPYSLALSIQRRLLKWDDARGIVAAAEQVLFSV